MGRIDFFLSFFPGVSYSTELPIWIVWFFACQRKWWSGAILRLSFVVLLCHNLGALFFIYIYFWSSGFILPCFLPLYRFPFLPSFLIPFQSFFVEYYIIPCTNFPPLFLLFLSSEMRGEREENKSDIRAIK